MVEAVYLCVGRPQFYKLIEECVTQIVLHKSGVDPDFRHTKRFTIDVEPLLGESVVAQISFSALDHCDLLVAVVVKIMLNFNRCIVVDLL